MLVHTERSCDSRCIIGSLASPVCDSEEAPRSADTVTISPASTLRPPALDELTPILPSRGEQGRYQPRVWWWCAVQLQEDE